MSVTFGVLFLFIELLEKKKKGKLLDGIGWVGKPPGL
jgi:hypothetical protein